jgi:CRP/FNR family transcriptional regulator
MEAFDGLEIGAELRIISDHEPRPLRGELERTRPETYVWLQRMHSADHWEVTLRRVAPPRTQRIREFLKRCALFADASPDTLTALEAVATEKTLAHNETVTEQGAEWDGFGIVEFGTLCTVIISPLGREHALYDILTAEPFGEISTIDGGETVARFVVTSRSARVVLFPKHAVRSALENDSAVARSMNDVCAQRMRALVDRFAAQTSLPTVARVAAVLLPHAGPQPGLHPVLPSFQHFTQVELATAAGTVKEVVSRALAELESAGAIERRGGHIVKVDRKKLAEYAGCL